MTATTHTFEKSISYDRETRDFRATLDGNYIGHFGSYYEAEVALDEVAYNLLMDGQCITATELDGGSDIDTIATSYVTKLRFDAGLICQYCGDDHADTTCPQRRSLLAPRVCGNCQGQHSIQACPEIRAALFAA